MSKAGAPTGNNNAGKGKEWNDALRYALANFETEKIERGQALKAIAKKVVEKAVEGDKDAIQEIGNRLDGKPAQAIVGPEGGPLAVEINSALIPFAAIRDKTESA